MSNNNSEGVKTLDYFGQAKNCFYFLRRGGEIMKKRLFAILLLLVVGTSCCFIGSSFAKYTSSISKSGSVAVAKWNFQSDNSLSTFNIALDENYDASTLLSYRTVDGNNIKLIAPGTSGSFDINLINTSEVGADFVVSLDDIDNIPVNIKFYKDSNYQTELIPGDSTLTGTLRANDATGVTVTIYWKWLYETGDTTSAIAVNDSLDTADGVSGSILTIPVTVKGTQVLPSTSSIISHIN